MYLLDTGQETTDKPDSPPLEPIELPPDSPPLEPVPLDSPKETKTPKETLRKSVEEKTATTTDKITSSPRQQPAENSQTTAPTAPLTKAEKKKLEWQKQIGKPPKAFYVPYFFYLL